jgi:hypothetical protein
MGRLREDARPSPMPVVARRVGARVGAWRLRRAEHGKRNRPLRRPANGIGCRATMPKNRTTLGATGLFCRPGPIVAEAPATVCRGTGASGGNVKRGAPCCDWLL